MSIQSYYRRALALPVVVPALVSMLLLLETRLPPDVGVVVFLLYWSLLIGGVPYVLFAVGFVLWARGRSDRELRRGMLLAPLVYALVLVVCVMVVFALDGSLSTEQVGMMGAFGVLFGYGYVILAEVGRVLLRPEPSGEPRLAS